MHWEAQQGAGSERRGKKTRWELFRERASMPELVRNAVSKPCPGRAVVVVIFGDVAAVVVDVNVLVVFWLRFGLFWGVFAAAFALPGAARTTPRVARACQNSKNGHEMGQFLSKFKIYPTKMHI